MTYKEKVTIVAATYSTTEQAEKLKDAIENLMAVSVSEEDACRMLWENVIPENVKNDIAKDYGVE